MHKQRFRGLFEVQRFVVPVQSIGASYRDGLLADRKSDEAIRVATEALIDAVVSLNKEALSESGDRKVNWFNLDGWALSGDPRELILLMLAWGKYNTEYMTDFMIEWRSTVGSRHVMIQLGDYFRFLATPGLTTTLTAHHEHRVRVAQQTIEKYFHSNGKHEKR